MLRLSFLLRRRRSDRSAHSDFSIVSLPLGVADWNARGIHGIQTPKRARAYRLLLMCVPYSVSVRKQGRTFVRPGLERQVVF